MLVRYTVVFESLFRSLGSIINSRLSGVLYSVQSLYYSDRHVLVEGRPPEHRGRASVIFDLSEVSVEFLLCSGWPLRRRPADKRPGQGPFRTCPLHVPRDTNTNHTSEAWLATGLKMLGSGGASWWLLLLLRRVRAGCDRRERRRIGHASSTAMAVSVGPERQ